MGVFLLVFVAACGKTTDGNRAPRFEKAPVVLISVDTLRSDRLPMYGYTKVETPALDALRKDSILFEKAYAHVPLTLPSHVSLFTGLEPGQHGVLDNSGYRLDPSIPTLAEILKKAGYRTGAAVSAVVLGSASGVARGFDFYDDRLESVGEHGMLEFVQRSGKDSSASLLGWISQETTQPLFAFLHTYEPHYPYEAPEPYRSKYSDPYDAEVAVSDAIIGDFLSELKKSGLYDRAVILFLSDHGEGLGEHGEQQHGIFLYRESIQVPLLVKLPKSHMANTKVAASVQLTDVFTSLGELLGLSGLPKRPGTVSLTALAAGAAPPDRRVFAENFNPRIRLGWSELRSLISDRHQYIEAPRPEFYDLVKDSAQLTNLASEKPAELRAMVAEMERRRTSLRPPQPEDPEQAKKLQSLGYLTGSSEDPGGPLPDPKDGIASLSELSRAVHLHESGKSAEAVTVLTGILKANPRLVDGWEILSSACERTGRPEDALSALKKTVQLSPPGRTNYIVDVANLALRTGHTDEAKRHAELAWEMGDARAAEVMGRVKLREKDLAGARTWAERALEKKVGTTSALLSLGRVAMLEGKFPEALARVDEVLAASGTAVPPAGAHLLRAEILGRQNQLDLAEAEYRKELAAYPRSIDALGGLAIISAAQGNSSETARRLDAMVRDVPTPEAYVMAINSWRIFGNKTRAEELAAVARQRFPGDGRFVK
ncbi:MAG: sulfatase-like hydrolase/transferase [Acidobacteria bacterium]|nr:sulfatase-like hydrolase/transferase [Acidobacteriota bacterium]